MNTDKERLLTALDERFLQFWKAEFLDKTQDMEGISQNSKRNWRRHLGELGIETSSEPRDGTTPIKDPAGEGFINVTPDDARKILALGIP